ncbi:MAG TPA: aminoacyl-tRNA hydrolase [Blastocatellia bacterium]|nr:aminoacyl-tRNA hydrolase [Blastocatellia bacterium]
MRLVVGLGNPGAEYEATWHNIGFRVVDRLFERSGGRAFRDESRAQVAQVALAGQSVLLVKAQTFMNLSGGAVLPLLEKYGDSRPENVVVSCDDAALPVGMIRVRPRGSAGGQKGLSSIVERLGSQEFSRVRLGIQPGHPISDLAQYVLSPVPRRLRDEVSEMVDRAADAVEMVLSEGVEKAMQAFNQRIKQSPESPD